MDAKRLVRVARGLEPADKVLKNAKIFAGFSGEFLDGDIALAEGYIAGIGTYHGTMEVDLKGQYLLPGFIDGHVHIESSMLTPCEFARAVLPQGTTTVVADPHEIANVCGLYGIRYMLNASENLPLNVYFTLSSCVPATHMEDSGAELKARDLAQLASHPRVVGLAEVMNAPGVLNGDDEVFAKLDLFRGKRIDGHAPGLIGRDVMAYASAGIESDHECVTLPEAQERLRAGMHLMLREGSAAHNVAALLPAVTPANSQFCFFATDDCLPDNLIMLGGIRNALHVAVSHGLDPITAIQMATVNTARYFRLHRLGVIAPGFRADMIVVPRLDGSRPLQVYKDGVLVAANGKLTPEGEAQCTHYLSARIEHTVHLAPLSLADLRLPLRGNKTHVMGLVPGQIITEHLLLNVPVQPLGNEPCDLTAKKNGATCQGVADPEHDLLKLAVFERHHATGRHSVCLVKGFGLKRGAIASTIGHDSHNLIVIGADDASMLAAAKELERVQGGVAVAVNATDVRSIPLEVGGLMAPRPAADVAHQIYNLHLRALELGVRECYDPFETLAFLSLPVIPKLKLTDRGLVDVERFMLIDPDASSVQD